MPLQPNKKKEIEDPPTYEQRQQMLPSLDLKWFQFWISSNPLELEKHFITTKKTSMNSYEKTQRNKVEFHT